jgi:hypothetical protein
MGTRVVNRDIRKQTNNERFEIEPAGLQVTPRDADMRGGKIWGFLRFAMGWTFLRAFLDKAFAAGQFLGLQRYWEAIAREAFPDPEMRWAG